MSNWHVGSLQGGVCMAAFRGGCERPVPPGAFLPILKGSKPSTFVSDASCVTLNLPLPAQFDLPCLGETPDPPELKSSTEIYRL